ncbi:MAG: hypothetical protein IKG81_09235 [Bacteroidales bacterium]|nr:hypothetical protein [Bacteroidales bacterium]
MKKIPLIPITAALLFAACDPGYNCDFAINNQTEHAITITSLDTVYRHKTVTAPALTDTVVHASGGLGFAEIPEVSTDIRNNIYGDSVQLLFDDGRCLKFHVLSDTNGGLYSFNDTNHVGSRYVYEPRMNTMTFKGHAGYCRYTLNITDDDYNRSE